MSTLPCDWPQLGGAPLCTADFEVGGAIMPLGRSPWAERRIGYITGGSFAGERLRGKILPGGGNWSLAGTAVDGSALGTFDARAIWQTDDGAVIYVTYTGRTAIPPEVGAAFRANRADVDPADYYIRIAPVFEVADERYGWLNGVLAVGIGHRMPWGIRHFVYAIG